MIPELAAEAGARSMIQSLNGDCDGYVSAEYVTDMVIDVRGFDMVEAMRLALKVAAPHMLAEVYDEAWSDARVTYTALFTGRNIPERFTIYNPYRAAK